MSTGYLSIVLHAHLPYVRHPEHDDFFEERWLFEAVAECYVPLLRELFALADEAVAARVTVSLSPPLLAMFGDPLLRARCRRHFERMVELGAREIARTRDDPVQAPLAVFHERFYREGYDFYARVCGGDLADAFARLARTGVVDLWTTAATHGYLPLLRAQPEAVRAQLRVGAEAFRRAIGFDPAGLWLPECAFYPGLEDEMKAAGFDGFVVDSHGILRGSSRAHYGLFAPVACGNGVAAFGRDPETSRQVWSATEGYPGDPDYRDFYRDIGFDLDLDYLRPFLPPGGTRAHTGFKYHRVTAREEAKDWYRPEAAAARVTEHAAHFLAGRRAQVREVAGRMDRPPVIVCPYDAELFGHWWFEGPRFLGAVLRGAAKDSMIRTFTPGDYLAHHPVVQLSTPAASSWGWQGFHDVWLNEGTERFWPLLHRASRRMTALAARHAGEPAGTLRARALNQAARELLLAQASDWPFLVKAGTAGDYARRRFGDHLARFDCLAAMIEQDAHEARKLAGLEQLDAIFPWLDFRAFAPVAG